MRPLSTIASLLLAAAPAAAAARGPHPGVAREIAVDVARDLPYCEIVAITGTPPDQVARTYDTTGASDCAAARLAAMDPGKAAEALHADSVITGPRRHWVLDQLLVFEVGETRDLDGTRATLVDSRSTDAPRVGGNGPYTPVEIRRITRFVFEKGKPVFLLIPPGKKIVYVMESYTDQVDRSLSLQALSRLGGRLALPRGWKFKVKKLERDLVIAPVPPGRIAHVLQDDLGNAYVGCGLDEACSQLP
jgi:hypothetical protein